MCGAGTPRPQLSRGTGDWAAVPGHQRTRNVQSIHGRLAPRTFLPCPGSPGPTSPAAETRQGSTYFRRDEVWGSPGGHEPPAGVRAPLLFSWGRSSPRPGARAPLGRRCLCAERCCLQTQPGTGWPTTPRPGPQPPARRALPPGPPPPGPRRRGRRDPRPRPLPTQSFGGGGKCPGGGPAAAAAPDARGSLRLPQVHPTGCRRRCSCRGVLGAAARRLASGISRKCIELIE
ncbi:uncharacterized protein LOC128929785 [Callithrix jacchus]